MQRLFSYGTLQQSNVQQAIFGRLLDGQPDILLGYALSEVEILDPDVVLKSGKTHHPILTFTGNEEHQVTGILFELTDEELLHADKYEVDSYKRVLAKFKSGIEAWLYVDAR